MNSESTKTSEAYALIPKLTDKLNQRRCGKSIALSNFTIYTTWKNMKSLYNSNNLKLSAPTWNDKFESPDGLFSVSNIQN